jgi:sulfate transport system substrate-binding protein
MTGPVDGGQPRRRRWLAAAVSISLSMLAALGPTSGVRAQEATPSFEAVPGAVLLAAYTTPREAYEEIIPMFQATDAGVGVVFQQSYGGSGDQSRAVENGLPADVAALSLSGTSVWSGQASGPDWTRTSTGASYQHRRPASDQPCRSWLMTRARDVDVITPTPSHRAGRRNTAAYQAHRRRQDSPRGHRY